MILAMMFLLTISANAAGGFLQSVSTPGLRFDGDKAICNARVTEYSKRIEVTMELWTGKTLLQTWTKSGDTSVEVSGEYKCVQRGKTYTLKVYGTSGGVAFSAAPKSKTA